MTLGSLPLWRRVGLGALAAVAAVILVALTWGITSLASPDPAGGEYSVHTYGPGGDVQFGNNSLSTGYCAVGQLSPGWSLTIDASRSEPHDMQVFGTIDVFGSSDTLAAVAYPGADEPGSTVRAYCALVFGTDRVTGGDKDSALSVSVLVPSERVWQGDADTSGSSTSFCVLSRSDRTQLTGSRLPDDT